MSSEQLTDIQQWVQEHGNEGEAVDSRVPHIVLLEGAWIELSRLHESEDIAEFLQKQQDYARQVINFWQGRLQRYFQMLQEKRDTREVRYGNFHNGIRLDLDPGEYMTVSVVDDFDYQGHKKVTLEHFAPLVKSDDVSERIYESAKVVLSGAYRSGDIVRSMTVDAWPADIQGWPGPLRYQIQIVDGSIQHFQRTRGIRERSVHGTVTTSTKTASISLTSHNIPQ